uniref:Uncharacterized protein n=1 Tax=Strongyloides venezuelensis TaxID=75913 RepID=A0A0K0EW77_STRVS
MILLKLIDHLVVDFQELQLFVVHPPDAGKSSSFTTARLDSILSVTRLDDAGTLLPPIYKLKPLFKVSPITLLCSYLNQNSSL